TPSRRARIPTRWSPRRSAPCSPGGSCARRRTWARALPRRRTPGYNSRPPMAALPSILMVFTGGTISMKIVPGRGAIPARGGREILEGVPQLPTLARIECEDFDQLPGPHWTPPRMLALAKRLDARLADPAVEGAVVTHGTDTLEETAYLLDLV